jgi:integrase/recombinase XerD
MVRQVDQSQSTKFDRKLKSVKKRIICLRGIPKTNIESIFKFDERSQSGGNSRLTEWRIFESFLRRAPCKPFRNFVRDDFNIWLNQIDKSLKPSTFNCYVNVVRRLFRFALDLEENETPPCMKGIKLKRIDQREREQRLSENLLDKSQVLHLTRMTSNKKYQAIIMTGFDGALRKTELMNIHIKEDLKIFEDYIELTVRNGKGGNTDTITLIDSVPYIKAWLSEHPFYDGDNTPPNTPLWTREKRPISNMSKIGGRKAITVLPLRCWAVQWILDTLANKAGMKKKLWPHILRHSKISSMLNDECQLITCPFFFLMTCHFPNPGENRLLQL